MLYRNYKFIEIKFLLLFGNIFDVSDTQFENNLYCFVEYILNRNYIVRAYFDAIALLEARRNLGSVISILSYLKYETYWHSDLVDPLPPARFPRESHGPYPKDSKKKGVRRHRQRSATKKIDLQCKLKKWNKKIKARFTKYIFALR